MKSPKIILIIAVLTLVLFGLVIMSGLITQKKFINRPLSRTPLSVVTVTPLKASITPLAQLPQPLNITALPIATDQANGGVDTLAPAIVESENQVHKLDKKLPFKTAFTSKNGIQMSILIASSDLQDNPWTLQVQIYGVDYQVTTDMASYAGMKSAFREAAQIVLQWLTEQGVQPDKMFIQWGDRNSVETKAQEWLK